MTSFYTRTGDDGTTGVLGEGRIPKDHPLTEAVGAVDEATAALGMARAVCRGEATAELLLQVQRDLYRLMTEISATPENAERFRAITAERVNWIEAQTDALTRQVEMPREFITPGDSQAGAALAMARTIVRRAERRVVRLVREGSLSNRELLRYLNRLSSLCFVLELYENAAAGQGRQTLMKD